MSVEIDYPLGISGLAVTAVAYASGAGDVAGTSLTFTENMSRLGYYSVTTSSLSAGVYWLQISVSGSNFDSQWVSVPGSGSVIVGGIGPGGIDVPQLTSVLKALIVRGYLVSTGVTSPVSADLWFTAGFFNSSPYYQSFTTGLFAWNNGTGWTISTVAGTNGSAYWTTASMATVVGPYTVQGTATGIPTIVAHGNAVLAGFQPDQTLLSSAQAATVPTAGTLARTSDVPTAVQNRQEMDSNSSRLANLDVTLSSRLASSTYVVPPNSSTIAAATAAVLFVDAATNKLRVNPDHTVSSTSGAVVVDNYIAVPAAVAVASQSPTIITCIRGDTLRVALPLLGNLTTRTKLVMTAKASVTDSDTFAVFQVIEGIGLSRLNGSDTVTAGAASLTVSDAVTGAVNLEIDANVTAMLAIRDLVWDVQANLASGISTPVSGTVNVVADVTQSVT